MKNILSLFVAVVTTVGVNSSFSAQTYTDSSSDIGAVGDAGGTANFLSAEVSDTSTDLIFKLNLNGSVATTNWAKFMIGISTSPTGNTSTGNGWSRPIRVNSPNGGINFWIGSWVDSGGGTELYGCNPSPTPVWSLLGASYNSNLPNVNLSAGNSLIYTISRAALGLTSTSDVTIYFDAFSSGGGGGDGAIDALSTSSVSMANWGDTTTISSPLSYTVSGIPEPSSSLLMGLGLAGLAVLRRARKNA